MTHPCLWGIILFLLSSFFIYGTVSDIPTAQLLIDQALVVMDEENYEEALSLFIQARDLDKNNDLIENYIASLSRIILLSDYRSDQEKIDQFIEEREKEKKNPLNKEIEIETEQDFITREKNKEKARQERSIGEILIYIPLVNSSSGADDTDNELSQEGNFLSDLGYNISFFPELFNRTIGVEGSYGSYSLEVMDEVIIYDEARAGLVLKNFFNEQPGFYSVLGTHFSAGLLFSENQVTSQKRMLTSWQIEAYFRDPFFYRIMPNNLTKQIALKGNFRFSLQDETYMLGYSAGLTLMIDKLAFESDFQYRSLLQDDVLYPSWMITLGVSYSFQ